MSDNLQVLKTLAGLKESPEDRETKYKSHRRFNDFRQSIEKGSADIEDFEALCDIYDEDEDVVSERFGDWFEENKTKIIYELLRSLWVNIMRYGWDDPDDKILQLLGYMQQDFSWPELNVIEKAVEYIEKS
jgi:hypothetical protein